MFWNAILDGLIQMRHWEIWVSIIFFGTCITLFYFTIGIAMMKYERNEKVQVAGCLTAGVGAPVVQGILVALMVTALFPILMGQTDFAPFSLIREFWWQIAKAGIISIGITIIFTFIPFLGDFIEKMPGTAVFVQGAILFHMLASSTLTDIVNQAGVKLTLWPGFWVSIGFVFLSVIIAYIFTLIVYQLLLKLDIIDGYWLDRNAGWISNFVGVIPGILCLCIYCAYVRLTIVDAIKS
jgi:hypothetical protein